MKPERNLATAGLDQMYKALSNPIRPAKVKVGVWLVINPCGFF
jgi:hypothetical protein